MATRFVELVRALTEEDGMFLLRYKRDRVGLGFAFETSPYMYADSRVENGFYKIIEKLPEDAVMQAFLWADDDIDRLLELIRKGSGLAGRLFEERYEYYKKAAREGGFYGLHPIRDFRLFLAFYIPIDKASEDAIERVVSIKEEITQTLDSLKMQRKDMTYKDFSVLLDKVLFGKSNQGVNSIEELVPKTFEVKEEGKRIKIKNGREYSIISPYFLPNRFHIAMMARLLGADKLEEVTSNLRRAFWISVTIRKKPIGEVKRLNAKGFVIERQAMGFGAKIAPHLKDAAKDFQILRERRNKGEKVVDLWLFAGAHPSEVNKLEELFTNVASEESFGISSFKVFIEEPPGPVLEDFIYSLPFCFPWGEKTIYTAWNRHFHLLGKDAVKFLPVMGDLKGNFAKEGDFPPALTFVSPKGQVMFVDIFNSAAGYNFITVASTGSGKSVLANDIINAYLAKGAIVRVIDVGGSYEKLASLYNAPCIEIDPENPICLNPFTNMENVIVEFEDEDGSIRKVNISTLLIRDLIFIMLGIRPEDITSYEERLRFEEDVGLVEKAINEVWAERGNEANIEDVIRRLPEHLQRALSRWIDNPWLRKFFVGKAEVNITDEPFYVIDLLKVKSINDTSLFNTLMYLVLINIQKNVYLLPRNLKKVVLFDESWEFLQDKHIVPYIVRGYRIARKFNASFGVITQSVEDFLSEHSKPIVDNSNFVFMLELGEQSLAFLEKREGIAMNPYAIYLAKSVTKHPKNLWSEILVYMRNQRLFGKARLFLDPFSKFLYDTTAEEVARIKQLEPRLGLIGAVELLAKKNPVTLAILKGWLTDAQVKEHGIDRIDDALAKGIISEWQYKELMKEWEEILSGEVINVST